MQLLPCYLKKRISNNTCSKVRNLFQSWKLHNDNILWIEQLPVIFRLCEQLRINAWDWYVAIWSTDVFVHENYITFEAVHALLAVRGLHTSPAVLSQQAEQQRQVQQSKESVPMSARCSTVLSAKRFQTVIWCDYSRELPIYSFHFISDCQIRFGTRL